jgi:hypothetical protein
MSRRDAVPLVKVLRRRRLPVLRGLHAVRVTETLECGHKLVALLKPRRGKRRCYACYDDLSCPICEGGFGPACASHFI